MKLTKDTLKKANTRRIRKLIAEELDCSERTISRYFKKNDEEGRLTTYVSVEIIANETGIPFDNVLTKFEHKWISKR